MWRVAATMLVAPVSRWRLTARLRRVAITAGAWPGGGLVDGVVGSPAAPAGPAGTAARPVRR